MRREEHVFAELLTSPTTGMRDAVSNHTIIQHLSLRRVSPLTNTLSDTAGSSPRSPPRGFWPLPPWPGVWAGPGHLPGSCPGWQRSAGHTQKWLLDHLVRHLSSAAPVTPLLPLPLPLHKCSVITGAACEFSLFQKLKERREVRHGTESGPARP